MSAESVARDHYRTQKRLSDAAARVAGDAWAQVDPGNVSGSWRQLAPEVTVAVAGAQRAAAQTADGYLDSVLSEQGVSPAADGQVVPSAFAGVASDGRRLDSLLAQPVPATLAALNSGVEQTRALAMGGAGLDMIVRTQIADAGRGADQVALVAHRSASGYVRLLAPPSCSRCAILAGRWYRYSSGFLRHPRCDCKHLPSTEPIGRDLTTNPRDYFDSLSREEQDRLFSQAGAQAIRDGADMAQVVNARRGMYTAGGRRLTRASTTRRGVAQPGRLTPEEIYRTARSRDEVLSLLDQHGYLRVAPAWTAMVAARRTPAARLATTTLPAPRPRARLATTELPMPTRPAAAVRRNPAELTGSDDRWWEQVVADTGASPIPVRNLAIQTNYVVTSGKVWRRDGVSYLVEDGAGAAGSALDEFLEVHRGISGAGEYQKAYAWLAGRNPADAFWAEKYRTPGFTSLATAGDGAVRVWNRQKSVFGPAAFRNDLVHEFGHNVSSAVASRGLHDRGRAWTDAVAADTGPTSRVSQFDSPFNATARQVSWERQAGRPFPDGVTNYGTSSAGEDYAESVSLYLAGQLGTGVITATGRTVPVYFRDIFPARAAVLDQVFPQIARQQRQAIASR